MILNTGGVIGLCTQDTFKDQSPECLQVNGIDQYTVRPLNIDTQDTIFLGEVLIGYKSDGQKIMLIKGLLEIDLQYETVINFFVLLDAEILP